MEEHIVEEDHTVAVALQAILQEAVVAEVDHTHLHILRQDLLLIHHLILQGQGVNIEVDQDHIVLENEVILINLFINSIFQF